MSHNLLSALYREHGPRLGAKCRSLLRDAARADDAMHDAFVKFIESYAHLAGEPEAPRLLDRIATNRCYDELRRARTGAASVAASPMSQHQRATQEDVILLKQVLGGLPEDERDVLLLRHADGMTLAQIAEQRGSSISSVRRYLDQVSADAVLLVTLVLILLGMCLAASQARGEERVQPAVQVNEPEESLRRSTSDAEESFGDLCDTADLRACAHLADDMYNRKDYARALILARGVCEARETPRSYRLQTCQRAGLLAKFHKKDEALARAMFERGCEGDASRDSKLDRAFRAESCARAR